MRRQSSYQSPNIDMASALAPEAVLVVLAVPVVQAVVLAVRVVVLAVRAVAREVPAVRVVPVCIRSPPDRAVGSTCVLAIQTDRCN